MSILYCAEIKWIITVANGGNPKKNMGYRIWYYDILWVSYGILLFMCMAINPLTLITSYYIISPWFVWIPMSQPDMRGSIDRSRSFPLEWNGRRIIPITSIPQHEITWQQLCFILVSDLAHPSAQIFPEDLALAGESFDPLRQVWVKMPAMDERQVYCLLATRFFDRWDKKGQEVSHREAMRLEPHWLIDMI